MIQDDDCPRICIVLIILGYTTNNVIDCFGRVVAFGCTPLKSVPCSILTLLEAWTTNVSKSSSHVVGIEGLAEVRVGQDLSRLFDSSWSMFAS